MIYFVLSLLVVALFIVVYCFLIHRMEERRNYELNESLRRNRKKVKREKFIRPPIEYPLADIQVLQPISHFTFKGRVNELPANAENGDFVIYGGKDLVFCDGKWIEMGLI